MLMVRRLKQAVLPVRLHGLRGERKALRRDSDAGPAAGRMTTPEE